MEVTLGSVWRKVKWVNGYMPDMSIIGDGLHCLNQTMPCQKCPQMYITKALVADLSISKLCANVMNGKSSIIRY